MAYMGARLIFALWSWASFMFTLPTLIHAQSGIDIGHIDSSGVFASSSCPARCACFGTTVDCADRGLGRFPRGVPLDTQRLDLQGNQLTAIYYSDLTGLVNLRILQLHDNKIHSIERGAFHDLKSLERLHLDRNKLEHLPDHIFTNCINLYKLELRHNSLKIIGKKLLKGLTQLRYLLLDDNQINCVDEQAFEGLEFLEILTLTNNNITTLWRGTFEFTPRLRALRVSGNKLICDCHLSWLGRWLAAAPNLAPYIRCSSPYRLKDRLVTDVSDQEFKCTGLVESVDRGCSLAPMCPRACRCGGGIVDCRDTGQTHIPTHIPEDTVELRLEHNEISQVPKNAFAALKLVKRIDLSNNAIADIEDNAFQGINKLTSLVLYGNKIGTVTSKYFRGLTNLQLLLLNANQIECVHKEAFSDLKNLNLLSLYDNQIMSLPNGTFSSLHNIQTMHLGSNPFVCDCHLSWLSRYLYLNPIETSGARCKEPQKFSRKPLGKQRADSFKCSSELRSKYSGQCGEDDKCPHQCLCEGTKVDCSGRDLVEPPLGMAVVTTHLDLSYNQLSNLDSRTGLKDLSSLLNLRSLDLSHNRLVALSSNFFTGARNLDSLDLSNNSLISIGSDFLRHLPSLVHLDVSSNHISCISDHILEHSPELKNLELLNNPLNCDCRIKWYVDWLGRNSSISAPICHLPKNVAGKQLTDIQKSNFECSDSKTVAGCDGATFCPPGCQCLKGVVRCSRKKLTQIPNGIPPDTVELYLDVNEIKRIIPERLKHLKVLRRLDLSNNQISIIPNNTFTELTSLAALVVSYNKLGCIERDSLMGLKSLRILSLHGNDISFLPEGTFRDLHSLSHIALGANPLYCDCSLAWLSKMVKNDYIEPGIAKCAQPRDMRDKSILSTPPQLFKCKGKIPNDVLAKCDLCFTQPCQNGGECQALPGRQYDCLCTPGFHGPECQYKIDACYGHPCINGGTCKVFEMGRFACHCPTGFGGERCEENIDDCIDNKCLNGATCLDGISSYSCSCPAGYLGRFCQTQISFCSKEFNPCKNGATCKDRGTDYQCLCQRGWSGDNCTINIDDCEAHMCQNEGQCVDGVDSYECKCLGDWHGRFCEMGPSVLQQTEPCMTNDCRHGVCMVPNGKSEYTCKCLPGYTGKYCEYQTTVSFVDKSSFLQLKAPSLTSKVNITMAFTTSATNGVLLYHGEAREHLAVELFQKRIRISFDCGNKPTSVMFSYEVVSNKKEHTVELEVSSQNITLRIDHGKSRKMTNRGESLHLEAKNPLFIGGVTTDVAAHAKKLWHLRNTTSFIGCINQLIINNKIQDLAKSEKQNKVVAGCGDTEQHDQGRPIPQEPIVEAPIIKPKKSRHDPPDPCENNKCSNGKCKIRRRKKKGYRCKCFKGFDGKFCNKAPTCRKESEKAHVYDYGCRSRRPIRQYRCEGSCAQQCCRAKRYRTKKVQMICNDGTKYVKKVDIIRKCRCQKRCGDA